ncbi:hypothetical protein NY2A_B212L [Paramecium bursaria Chlorella virus NY2A]|uniref:Uncharacterized protein B212L n=1 Tax=Paramecium bursaria Chlorella virus NY2A TaxID=46021 RepID=A7IW87_PBCVN|nr:hypothetical protein NY2A_B212L [Paramecium bursaria Chlorella virus NY2A]ABT14611.1 hypothetical protein NY2A_B212L [Paramecium bursaria Chlorella virus NY2A]
MTEISHRIQYTPSLEKTIHWSKDWIKHYEPDISKKDLDDIFDDVTFVKKYSSKPPPNLTSKEILSEAKTNVESYTSKVTKKIKDLKLDDEKKILKKVMEELPDAETLMQILLSYRIYNTEGKQRVRIPSKLNINVSNIDVKKFKKNNA